MIWKKLAIGIGSLAAVAALLFGIMSILPEEYNEASADTISLLGQKEEAQIYVLHKPTCTMCQKYKASIKKELEPLKKDINVNTYFVDVTQGIPSWLTEKLPADALPYAKTPYVIYLNGKDNNGDGIVPRVQGRVDNDQALENLAKSITHSHETKDVYEF